MTVEAYIATEAVYQDGVVADVFVFPLYDGGGSAPRGALTTRCPLASGKRGGPLIVKGIRRGRRRLARLGEVEVVNSTARGREFRIHGEAVRKALAGVTSRSGDTRC